MRKRHAPSSTEGEYPPERRQRTDLHTARAGEEAGAGAAAAMPTEAAEKAAVTKKINDAIEIAYVGGESLLSADPSEKEEIRKSMVKSMVREILEGVFGNSGYINAIFEALESEHVSIFKGVTDSAGDAAAKRVNKLSLRQDVAVKLFIDKNARLLQDIFKGEEVEENDALVARVKNMSVDTIVGAAKLRIRSLQAVVNSVSQQARSMSATRKTEAARVAAAAAAAQKDIQSFIRNLEYAKTETLWQDRIYQLWVGGQFAFGETMTKIDNALAAARHLGASPLVQAHLKLVLVLGIAVVGFIEIGGKEKCAIGYIYDTCTPIFPAAASIVEMLKNHAIATGALVVAATALPAAGANSYSRMAKRGGSRKKRMSRSRPLRRRRKGKKTKKIFKKRRSGSRKIQKGRSKHSPTRRSKHSPTRRSKM